MMRLLYRIIFNIFCTSTMKKNSIKSERTFRTSMNQSMTTYLATLHRKSCRKNINDVKFESIVIYISTITFSLDRKISTLH